MALPLIAGGIFSGVLAGLTQFFASKAATMLTGLGVALVVTKGLETIAGAIISDIQQISTIQFTQGGSAMLASPIGTWAWQMMGYGGVIDGVNILLSGYMTYYGFIAMKVVLTRLNA